MCDCCIYRAVLQTARMRLKALMDPKWDYAPMIVRGLLGDTASMIEDTLRDPRAGGDRMGITRFNEIRKWAIRLSGPYDILANEPQDPYDGFVGATFFTREAAEAAMKDSEIDGEVVPVLLLVIEVSKAEADAEYRYYKTHAERAANVGEPADKFLERIVDSLRKRIALLQEELKVELADLAKLKERER